ncbi:transferrin-binding protein-like solute binding protein [Xenorhabdus sp. Flor]|uniref:Slam-dependent surface lipoprotein n=1 Tax=Xenorhabdus cabanillasii TaxID=351673 RepID=UPI0019B703E5|nr:Slam-dependent surface lipoprotein [Xenorhabdus sp. Flor]MBD2816308.1 transferrin-binding protein-like solute binding protein [Xenorhabdus sp. Flor]
MKKVNILIALLVGALGLITQAQAKVGYGISQTETTPHLILGEKDNEPAIGISLPIVKNKLFTASKLKRLAKRDNNGIYDFKLENLPGIENQYIDVAQVPNEEVYFGEWAQKTPDKSDKTHTVFYTGKDVTTNMPKGGTAIYNVKGLSQYNGHNLLSGRLVADFDAQKLNGSLSNNSLNIGIDANINQDAGFSGKATANGNINGVTDGKFYGDSASALAGYAKFDSDRSKDTAFGGNRQ